MGERGGYGCGGYGCSGGYTAAVGIGMVEVLLVW